MQSYRSDGSEGYSMARCSTDAIKSKIHSGLEWTKQEGREELRAQQPVTPSVRFCTSEGGCWCLRRSVEGASSCSENITSLLFFHITTAFTIHVKEQAQFLAQFQSGASIQPQYIAHESHCTELHVLHPSLLCGLVSAALDLRHWTSAWCRRLEPWGRTPKELFW